MIMMSCCTQCSFLGIELLPPVIYDVVVQALASASAGVSVSVRVSQSVSVVPTNIPGSGGGGGGEQTRRLTS